VLRSLLTALAMLGSCAGVFAQAAPPTDAVPASWKQLLQTKQHVELDARIKAGLDAAATDLDAYRFARRSMEALVDLKPASAGPFDEWVASTSSGAAHLARANFHSARSWQARGDKFIRDTHPDALVRMNQLMAEARSDYETALTKLGKQCDLCYAGLLEARFVQGERTQALRLLDEAMHAMGGGIATPREYLRFLHPKWGGSWPEMERFVERFAADYAGSPAVPLLRSALLVERAIALADSNKPAQAIPLLEQALVINPGNSLAWERLATTALVLDKDAIVLQATDKSLAMDPDSVYSLDARASVLLKSSAPLDAVPFLERAVALGSDWALQALLPIIAAGKHGFVADRARAEKVCQSAIDALMPSGFACMGGLNYFGMGRAPDKPKALQWFAEAADRGVPTAMVDAGLMLARGDGVPADRDRAVGYWIKAKLAGEPRAEGHLRANLSQLDYARKVSWPEYKTQALQALKDNKAQTRVLIGILVFMAGSLFCTFLYSAGDKPARRMGTLRQLRAGTLLRVLAIFNLAIAIGGCYAVRFAPADQRVMAWVAIGLILLGALYLLYAVFLTKVSFDDFAVYYESPFAGRKEIHFDDIAQVGWSWLYQSDFVESVSGDRIFLSRALEGYEELGDMLSHHLNRFDATQPA
jgi:tetratricopeptide (TPR) repeat protein